MLWKIISGVVCGCGLPLQSRLFSKNMSRIVFLLKRSDFSTPTLIFKEQHAGLLHYFIRAFNIVQAFSSCYHFVSLYISYKQMFPYQCAFFVVLLLQVLDCHVPEKPHGTKPFILENFLCQKT